MFIQELALISIFTWVDCCLEIQLTLLLPLPYAYWKFSFFPVTCVEMHFGWCPFFWLFYFWCMQLVILFNFFSSFFFLLLWPFLKWVELTCTKFYMSWVASHIGEQKMAATEGRRWEDNYYFLQKGMVSFLKDVISF